MVKDYYMIYIFVPRKLWNDCKYYCKLCDYGTFAKKLNENHNNSEKHKKHEKYYK